MNGPHPAVAAARRAVADAVADLPDGTVVLVACSGGPDSLALAAATAFVATRSARPGGSGGPLLRAGAVVVDHGLQPGSAEVATEAARVCRDLGLDPVEVVRVRPGDVGGPEAAARTARYAALDAAAARHGAAAVLLGHTRDDQAETVLLGLARGSGSRSLAGMAARRGLLRRPLLGLGRADTLAVCAALDLRPWADPTNEPGDEGDGSAPARSRLRARVLPVLEAEVGPGVARALARTADLLRQDADALDGWAAQVLDAALTAPADPATPSLLLDVATLAEVPVAVRTRVLRSAAVRAGAPPGALVREHVLALDALVTRWRGQGPVHLPGGLRGVRVCGRLELRAEPPRSST
ncbi:tRNA lysidine(34) synthetase TilS [Cellulomonas hominis]